MNYISKGMKPKLALYKVVRDAVIEANVRFYNAFLPICEKCKVPIRNVKDVEVDHIFGHYTADRFALCGFLSPRNMQVLHPWCHSGKTDTKKSGEESDFRKPEMKIILDQLELEIVGAFEIPLLYRGQWHPSSYKEAWKRVFKRNPKEKHCG
jgi:hypothetical protein